MNLSNLVLFITLIIATLLYIIQNFLARYLENYWIKHGTDINLARTKRNDFVEKWRWVILMLYIAAIAFGAIGILRD